MKLEEAIEILEVLSDGTVEQIYTERTDAIGLGIEALKDLIKFDEIRGQGARLLLPGETE